MRRAAPGSTFREGGKIGVIARKLGREKHFEGAKFFGEGKKFLGVQKIF